MYIQLIWRCINLIKRAFSKDEIGGLTVKHDAINLAYKELVYLTQDDTSFTTFEKAVALRKRSLYIGEITIFPLKVVLSIQPGQAAPDLAPEDFVSYIAGTGVSVEKSKFKLKALELKFIQCAPEVFLEHLRQHYTIEGVRLLYKVSILN